VTFEYCKEIRTIVNNKVCYRKVSDKLLLSEFALTNPSILEKRKKINLLLAK